MAARKFTDFPLLGIPASRPISRETIPMATKKARPTSATAPVVETTPRPEPSEAPAVHQQTPFNSELLEKLEDIADRIDAVDRLLKAADFGQCMCQSEVAGARRILDAANRDLFEFFSDVRQLAERKGGAA